MTDYSKVTERKTKSGISFWVEGKSGNPALILMAGFTGTHGDLLSLARELKEKYFILIPEFPGWGEVPEEKSSLTIESYAHVVQEIIASMSLEKVVLVGHCMGGVVALECGYEFPNSITHTIIMSPPYQEGTPGQVFFKTLGSLSEKVPQFFRPAFFFWRSRIITVPLSFFVIKTRSLHKKLSIISKTMHKQTGQNEHVLEKNWISLIEFNYHKLNKLSMPIDVIHGEEDLLIPLTQARKLAALLPHATFHILKNGGHLPPVEEPGTVARLIEQILTN